MDYATAIPISVGIIAVVGGLIKIKGNGKRPTLMTEEARENIKELWDHKQSKEQCEIIADAIKEDIKEIKESQKETRTDIKDIKDTLIKWGKTGVYTGV